MPVSLASVVEKAKTVYEFVIGAMVSTSLLILEHALLWNARLSRVSRYTLGTTALFLGISVALLLLGDIQVLIGIWAIVGIGGAVVGGLHLWRTHRGEQPGEIESAYLAGQLTKEAIIGTTRER